MERAAIGIRVHSGWGALVVVSGRRPSVEVLDRRRVVITNPNSAGANQPYHHAQKQTLPDAERSLADCAITSERLALEAIGDIVIWKGAERLQLQVTGIPERELDGRAEAVFGRRTIQLRLEIAVLGGSLGPPWTTDQKTAALAALLVLASEQDP